MIGFSGSLYLLFPHKLLYAQTHCTNGTSGIVKRRCKAIPAFGFNTYHSRETLLTLLFEGENYGST